CCPDAELFESKRPMKRESRERRVSGSARQPRHGEVGNPHFPIVGVDLTNLQASTKLAIVLLGRDLTIRRFSPQAEKQFNLLATDVGRPISHIRHNLVLADDVRTPLDLEVLCVEVITSATEKEREVLDKAGRWHSLRVRPYTTRDK